jgi:ParB family chromosome partitioning protein
MSKDRRLGRGLAALLGSSFDEAEVGAGPEEGQTLPFGKEESLGAHAAGDVPPLAVVRAEEEAQERSELLHLNVQEVETNPFQPRREFNEEEIASLSESLKAHDMLQPILVRRVEGRYQLISGERRLRAAQRAGWTTIPARVREADDRPVAELAIVENLQRKDLNPVEKALSFKRYLDEHRCTQEELAQRLAIDRSTIANLMRLLELPKVILASLQSGKLTAGHARALLPLGEERAQLALARQIESEQWSVRAVELYVADLLAQEDAGATVAAGKKSKRTQTAKVASLEQELRSALGTKVEIKASARGRGKITIHFHSHEEYERLHDLLCDRPRSARKAA